MDCENFHKKLADYTNLSDSSKAEMEQHAQTCAECARELAEYQEMLTMLKSLPELKAPEDFAAKLSERIDKEKPAREKAPGLWIHLKQHGYRYSAAAACVMLAVVIGVNSNEFVERMRDTGSETPYKLTDSHTERPRSTAGTAKPEGSPSPTAAASAQPSSQPTAAASKSTAAAAKATHKPLATAIPSVSKPSTPTLSPKATKAPSNHQTAASTPAAEEQQPESAAPTSAPAAETPQVFSSGSTETPQSGGADKASEPQSNDADSSSNDILVASVQDYEETEGASDAMMNPDLYSLPDEESSGGGSGGAGGYTRATETENSIEVSSANAERARAIISEYSVASSGDCYSVSSDRMEEFLEAMNNAGIDYSQNCVDVGSDTVTFRLIIS